LAKTYSLLCPTRGRPAQAREAVLSAFETAHDPGRLESLLYVDNDDPTLPDYKTTVENLSGDLPDGKVRLISEPRMGVGRAFNHLATVATGDVFVTATDDQFFLSEGWDTRLDAEIDKLPDDIYCLWFNDNWESQNFCTAPILSRTWVETLGYMFSPLFEHFFSDAWIWMLAKTLDRAVYIEDMTVEHRHWKTGKVAKDETYEANESKPGDSRYARDREVIDRFERYFHVDVELLRGLMK